jgi:hypothetical protein
LRQKLLKAKNAIASMPMHDNPIDASAIPSKRVIRVFGLSLHSWEDLMIFALAIVGVFGVVVGVATFAVVRLQRAEIAASKDEFEKYKIEAGEKISAAEAVGQTAQADIAKAAAQIAEANARTKEAELKLEQLRKHVAARHINTASFIEFLNGKPKQPVEIMFVKDDGEAFGLAIEIRGALTQAKWEVREPIPIPPTAPARLANLPSTMGAGGQPSGVSVVARAVSQDDFKMIDPGNDSAFRALSDALGDSLGHIAGAINSDASPEYGTLRVVVGPKINPN